MPEPTQTKGIITKITDGDTVVVTLPELGDQQESLRLLAIDTEESYDDNDPDHSQTQKGGKPITKLGNRAKAIARKLLAAGDEVNLMFPDEAPLDVALVRHRGNYGRLLCFLHLPGGRDFQELMIREGLSPYLTKYGYAPLLKKHFLYSRCEAQAQAEGRGIWSSEILNYKARRNYEHLLPWWQLRARVIENYRNHNRANPAAPIPDSRLDYQAICNRAAESGGEETTVFTELRFISLAGNNSAIVEIGSSQQPFILYIPAIYSPEGQKILRLLKLRYLTLGYDGSNLSKAGCDYAYVTGELKLYRNAPEIVVTRADQIADSPPV